MITPEGRVKILDFGLAKQTALISQIGETRTIGSHSSPGSIAGTASYMSPEQVGEHAIDPRSDIFSFGILLHELFSIERPSTDDSSPEVMSAILRDDPRPLPRECRRQRRASLCNAWLKSPSSAGNGAGVH